MQQQASSSGTGNTIVQIAGDGNSVTIGNSYLRLTRFMARRHIRQDLDRLSPYTRSIPLVGREEELASLRAFLDDPRRMSARVLVGGGGSGKTRLALELCEQAHANGWNAGFATGTELSRFFAQQNLSDWGWQKPTLVVVDYAAAYAGLLSKLLDELTDRAELPQYPLRLLLLERSASTETGWWTTAMTSGGWGATSKRALLDPAEPVPIRPLVRAEDRLTLLTTMLAQASPTDPLRVPLEDAAFRNELMQLDWGGDPLFLMMAALAMVQVGHAKALALGRTDLADALAMREANRLQHLAEGRNLDPVLVQHLAACVTLAQGIAREDFEQFATGEKEAIRRPSGGDAAQLADVLQEALPRPDGIAPVLPDLIGEALLLRTLRGKTGISAVLRCHAAFGRRVAESVIRSAQDFAQQTPAPLQWLEAILESIGEDEEALAALADSLPLESTVLRELNLEVAQRLHTLRAAHADVPTHSRASSLHNLALAQAMLSQHEAALHTAQEAVDLYRDLTSQQPDVFQPDLAMALNNLSNRLSDLGQREAALHAAQEALGLDRNLAAQQPNVFRPDLARSLGNLAIMLSDVGQHGSAVHAVKEVVSLYRDLAVKQRDLFQPNLARSLSNSAIMLRNVGEREAALYAAQEAVDIRRELASQRPDVFRPDLARSLNTLASSLSDLGRREPALHPVQEAVDLYRDLAIERPEVFRPQLAMSLNTLANVFCELRQLDAALYTAKEALDFFRVLAIQRPEVFLPDLAESLFILAHCTRDADNNAAGALSYLREAVVALRPEFLRHSNVHAKLMGKILGDYLQLCETVGKEPDHALLEPLLLYFNKKNDPSMALSQRQK